MLLGEPPGSAKLEHMQLSVDSVVAVARQRQGEAVAEAEERLRAGQAERQAKAVRAAEEKAAAALEALRKTAEEEKRKLQAKVRLRYALRAVHYGKAFTPRVDRGVQRWDLGNEG